MKIDRAKETSDFEAKIAALAQKLSGHRIVIARMSYSGEAFGSWEIVVGTKEKKFDFFYDGQVSELRYHDASITPKDYRDFLEHKRFRTWEGEDPLAFVEEVLVREFPA